MESLTSSHKLVGRVSMKRVRFFLMSEVFGKRAELMLESFMGEESERAELMNWVVSKRDNLVAQIEMVDDPIEIESSLVTYYMLLKSEWSLMNSSLQYSMMSGEFDEAAMFRLSLLSMVISSVQLLISSDDVEAINEMIARPLCRERNDGVSRIPVVQIERVLESLKNLNYHCSSAAGALSDAMSLHGMETQSVNSNLSRSLSNLQSCIILLNEDKSQTLLDRYESVAKEVLAYTSSELEINLRGGDMQCQIQTMDALYDIGSNFFREILLRILGAGDSSQERLDTLCLETRIRAGKLIFDIKLNGHFVHMLSEQGAEPDEDFPGVLQNDVQFAFNAMRQGLVQWHGMHVSIKQSESQIQWIIVSDLRMAVEGILTVDTEYGRYGIHQHMLDRIVQGNQATEHESGGSIRSLVMGEKVYRVVNVFGETNVRKKTDGSRHSYLILHNVDTPTAVAVDATVSLARTIPDPMPPLMRRDPRISGVMFDEKKEMILLVSPSVFDVGDEESFINDSTISITA